MVPLYDNAQPQRIPEFNLPSNHFHLTRLSCCLIYKSSPVWLFEADTNKCVAVVVVALGSGSNVGYNEIAPLIDCEPVTK